MILKGIGASDGIVFAEIWHFKERELIIEHREGCDKKEEALRIQNAISKADHQLEQLYEKTMESDEESAMIFDIHRMMLEDPDFCEGISEGIESGYNAEWAIEKTAATLRSVFAEMDDPYMNARAADVTDVSNRLLRILSDIDEESGMPSKSVIVAAEDLLPSQTVKLDKKYVAGYITRAGSMTSHSAILARSMGIPCVVGMGDVFASLPESGELIMDGGAGIVIVTPSAEQKTEYEEKRHEYETNKRMLEQYRSMESRTASGQKCAVCANIGNVEDAKAARAAGAEGIGLFRSEFLYLDGDDFPSEETQYESYRQVLEIMDPYPVVIRTLDLGSDKQAPYFNIPDEENPAMGYRAIRICLDRPDIFHTQLRALLRAGQHGNLCIMFPMITGLSQVKKIKEHLALIKQQLLDEGYNLEKSPQIGIMIETPAAAVMSDVLAKELDFFSIGTNDLTQYTLAADRMNPRVNDIFKAEDPAVLRLIEMTAKNAHEAGIWVGICGEAGANVNLTPFFMDVGIDELSVAASSVLKVKKAVCDCK